MPRSTSHTLFNLLAASALTLFVTACDPGAEPVEQGTTPPASTIDPTQSTGGGSIAPTADVIPDGTEKLPVPTFEGLGEEDPSKLIPVGKLNGTWRVGMANVNNDPVMHIDFVHDQGASTATCDFVMYWQYTAEEGKEAYFPDKIGKCASVTFQGSTLTLLFNPTEQFDYNMTLTASLKGDDTFEGTISAPDKDGTDTWDIVIERRTFDPNDDGVRPAAE